MRPSAQCNMRTRSSDANGVGDDDAAVLDDRQPIHQSLDLVQFVRGQEYGAPVGDGLADQVLKLVLQQRVQTGSRLIEHEHEQVGRCMNACTRPIFCRLPLDKARTGRSSSALKRATSSSR